MLDAKGQPVPFLYEGTNVLPLYFHLENDLLAVGAFAKESFRSGTKNTFGDFYNNLLRADMEFTRFHKKEPFRKLLFLFLKENVLPRFVKQQGNAGQTLEAFLSSRPIRLLFDYCLTEPQIEVLLQTFVEVLGVTSQYLIKSTYWELLKRVLEGDKSGAAANPFIAVFAAHNDLHFCLLSPADNSVLVREIVAGRGAHPQQDLVSEIIAERAIEKSGSMLSLVEAKGEVLPRAGYFLSQMPTGIIEGKVRLSDVGEVHVQFLSSLLQARLDNRASLNLIQSAFDTFRSRNHAAEVPVFLIGEVLNSESYQQFFSTTYNKVHPEPAGQKKELLIECFKVKQTAPANIPPRVEVQVVPVGESSQIVSPPPPVVRPTAPATPPPLPEAAPTPVVESPKSATPIPPAVKPGIPPPVRRSNAPAIPEPTPTQVPTPAVVPAETPPPRVLEVTPSGKPAVPPSAPVKPPIPTPPLPRKPGIPPPPKRK